MGVNIAIGAGLDADPPAGSSDGTATSTGTIPTIFRISGTRVTDRVLTSVATRVDRIRLLIRDSPGHAPAQHQMFELLPTSGRPAQVAPQARAGALCAPVV